ncbi:MAG: superoxide dismutase family protein [Clostridia bacterium]|nr:superoxide dismutase family protein [Clostridia bacterium]
MFNNLFVNAKATIKGSSKFPNIKGIVYFKETSNGVIVTAKIYNLPAGSSHCDSRIFGFHIHQGTSCTGNVEDPFKDALTHFNPLKCKHPHHAGDLPPLFENNGYAYISFLTNRFKIKDIIGKAVIIHSNPDDFTTDPSGNSGVKIACGLIEE